MSDLETIPTLTHATERDVDLLLIEELKCSRRFIDWFCGLVAAKVDAKIPFSIWTVQHSRRRTYNRREIDIYVELRNQDIGPTTFILVENKLKDTEQPGQAESYLEECDLVVAEGRADFAYTVLVCPESYVRTYRDFAGKFHVVVSYESIGSFLGECARDEVGEISSRLTHRQGLLEQAIHEYRRGYEPILQEGIGTFNGRYVALCRELHPELVPGPSMTKSEGNPCESVSMIFDPVRSFEGIDLSVRPRRLAHEFGKGQEDRTHYAAITIPKWGKYLDEIRDHAASDLEGTPYVLRSGRATAKRPNPGLVIHAETPPVDNQADFDEQRGEIVIGLDEVARLRRWFISNQEMLERWQRLISE